MYMKSWIVVALIIALMAVFSFLLLTFANALAQSNATISDKYSDWINRRPDGCTTITVGKSASADGSVTTSHTCDSHRTRAWLDIVPARRHKKDSPKIMRQRTNDDSLAMPAYKYVPVGTIPEVESTFGYINTAYPCMNDQQLAIGESTFGGRATLRSNQGLIDCQQLVALMIERCQTAREAIHLAGDLTKKYGYIDSGECLTIADPKEVWHLEIVGPGAGKIGSIWAAQRVPDDHVSVNANASRIRHIDLTNPDHFLASENICQVAQDSGWWCPEQGQFQFNYAYDPDGRKTFAARRREWRVLDLVAPSLGLDANAENFPFSVKPDTLVTLAKLVSIFKDYFEGTDYDMTKNITVTDDSGKTIISPLANPFMPYDMNKIFRINGGWGWLGERTIARWYTMYATITQSRDHLPDGIGGVVWLAFDNVATSIYVPIYCGNSDVPKSYKTPGREKGFSRECAWWAFNRLGTLAAQRWGDMRHDVDKVWCPWQKNLFANQHQIEAEALALHQQNPKKARAFLTDYCIQVGDEVVKKCWELGDFLWTKYDEKF